MLLDLPNTPVTQRKEYPASNRIVVGSSPSGSANISFYTGVFLRVQFGVLIDVFLRKQKSAKNCLGRCASGSCGRSVSPVRAGSIPLRLAKLPGKPE